MILYHGSYIEIENPDLKHSRDNVDFGRGFYATPIYEQTVPDYDVVIGGVANDKVFNTVELYFDGLIDKAEALNRLRYEKPNHQVCLRTEEALKCLSFEGGNEV